MHCCNTNLAGAIASVLMLGFATNAAALSPQVVGDAELARRALTVGVDRADVVDRVDGQYRADGVPVALFAPDYRARVASPRAMAFEYLAARGERLGLDATAVANLAVTAER
ncbi:MAG TPA: hypothetical protein VJ724_02835, partial [Tahibacter sp.]|nr:hypothetical protein [Tahibacter sp.]